MNAIKKSVFMRLWIIIGLSLNHALGWFVPFQSNTPSRVRAFMAFHVENEEDITGLSPHDEYRDDNDDDFCRQIMGSALIKMASITDPKFEFNKRIRRLIEVKESTIPGAGMGLFAKEKIKAGTLISFYPAHITGIHLVGESDDGDDSAVLRKFTLDDSGKVKELAIQQEDISNNEYVHYVLGNRLLMKASISKDLRGESIFLDVDTSRAESPGWSSHRVNDGATVLYNSQDGVLQYYRASRKAKNCVLVPFGPSPLLATITTKKVDKGEEFFTTYGCSYWLEQLLEETGETEETDMTDTILLEAKEVAMDVMKTMKSVSLTYVNEINELNSMFDLS